MIARTNINANETSETRYPVRRWALNGTEISKSGKNRNREWNYWMPFNAYELKCKFHSRFSFFPDLDISIIFNAQIFTGIFYRAENFEIHCLKFFLKTWITMIYTIRYHQKNIKLWLLWLQQVKKNIGSIG